MRDDGDLVGWGMATGIWEALQMPITVRIVLSANGHAEVACATSDIGTGTYTIMTQVAADMLGLPLENISIKLGDSSLPQSPVEGGSWIAASVSNGIATTADAIRDELLRLAKQMPSSPLANMAADEVTLADGKLVSKGDASRSVSIADAMRHSAVDRIEQEKTTSPSNDTARAHNTHAAIFAEVKVDEQLGVIRVTRELTPMPEEAILDKITMSAFEGTPLALARDCGTLSRHRRDRNRSWDRANRPPRRGPVCFIPVIIADACGAGDEAAARRSLERLRFAGDAIITDTEAFTPETSLIDRVAGPIRDLQSIFSRER